MSRRGFRTEIELNHLKGADPFIIAINKKMEIVWTSTAVVRRLRNAVGKPVSNFVEFISAPKEVSARSIRGKVSRRHRMTLAAAPPLLIEGRWLPASDGFVLLASPVLRSLHDISSFSSDELPEESGSAELLAARDRLAKARKKTARAEESLTQIRRKNENLNNRIADMETRLAAAISEIHNKTGSNQAMVRELAEVMNLIESFDRPPEPIRFSLRDCFGDALKSLGDQARRKGLELACHIPPGVPDCLTGDPARLRLIIVTLTGKAIQFTRRDAVIVSVREFSRTESEAVLECTVTHTGLGGNLNDNRTGTQPHGQSRPGMAIATRLVEMMKGTIHEESGPGGRKAVRFTARFTLATDRPESRDQEESDSFNNLPVLLAYANITNRQILHEMLYSWGLAPTVVGSGPETLEAVARARDSGRPFSLILIDDMMAGTDGFALAERIRRVAPQPQPGIILLTTNMTSTGSNRMNEVGINSFLTKPIKESELKDTIRVVSEQCGSDHDRMTLPEPSGRKPVPVQS